ncbi:peptide transporter family 1-like [Bradysia coprophila]|uniref:peptide transporter family 1-like n=1 Tax=Bradysia coprophila TaxID=38358 RepID=UPI00187DCC0C|nr:peptide transporter family 1-like [Bradysia coprophila]
MTVTTTAAVTAEKVKSKYPKSIAFIVSNEFCERFSFYGMKTILVLYLTRRLGYDDDGATVLYHVFTSLVYFCPLFGAIIADSLLGRFKTILYLSIVYAIGSITLAVGAIPPLHLPASTMTVIGLMLISIGTGGIKPCVAAFGGDQFKIPEQAKMLATFFSLFYMSINAGSLISTTVTPILREDVHCFGEEDCFSLAFGVPGVLMITSIIIFIVGRSFYKIEKPTGNMFVEVSKCIGTAIVTKVKATSNTVKSHWLDYAESKYSPDLIDDVKSLMKILVLYIPLPFFWALQDQQGSRWTFQATRMNGEVGGLFTIKPDQMQVINPLLIILFIPLWDLFVYPMLSKIGIRRPLQKLTFGMILAGLAFSISGFVELKLESGYPILPRSGQTQIRIFNGLNCAYDFRTDLPDDKSFRVASMSLFERKIIQLDGTRTTFTVNGTTAGNCGDVQGTFRLEDAQATSYFLTQKLGKTQLISYVESPDKPKKGFPVIRVLLTSNNTREVTLKHLNRDIVRSFFSNSTEMKSLLVGEYAVYIDNVLVSGLTIEPGAAYTLVLQEQFNGSYTFQSHAIVPPNDVHILWQIPQYIIVTAGEIMFSVTGLEFSYTQAPESMKSVLQACWLLAVAFGNIIVVIVAEVNFFESQASEFFLFAGCMALNVLLFVWLASRYRYRQVQETDNSMVMSSGSTPMTTADGREANKTGIENYAYNTDM